MPTACWRWTPIRESCCGISRACITTCRTGFPSPPVLLTVTHEGKRIDAVAQATKQGYLCSCWTAITGRPLFPVTETPVPQTDVPGEECRTQPVPSLPAPYARQHLDEGVPDRPHARGA